METKIILDQIPGVTFIKTKCPNPNPGYEFSYQAVNSKGTLLIDHRKKLPLLALEFTLNDIVECYNIEVTNGTLTFCS